MTRPVLMAATPTIFDPSGEVDIEATTHVFEHAVTGGAQSLLVNGSTAEFPALTQAERRRALHAAVEVAGVDRVVAHVGAASPWETRQLAQDADSLGVWRIAVITPYYLPVSLDGVIAQITAVKEIYGDSADLSIYHFPERTGVHLTPAQLALVIEDCNLSGAKISIPGLKYLAEVAGKLTSPRTLLSGDDTVLREVMAWGGAGVVSGVASATPAPFAALIRSLESGETTHADLLASVTRDLAKTIGQSVSNLKYSLQQQGVVDSVRCRMAVDTPGAKTLADVRAVTADPMARADKAATMPSKH